MKVILIFVLFSHLILLHSLFAQELPYDELRGGKNDGEIIDHYKKYYGVYESKSSEEKKELFRLTKKDFKNEYALHPLPRVISENEFNNSLRPGVEQRAKALRMFLVDHYSGKKSYIDQGIIPKKVIDQIVERSGETDWAKYVRPKDVAFWYGPDIIRDPLGNFRIIEDNPGFIGGPGDIAKARESILKRVPEYTQIINADHPEEFYKEMVQEYRNRLGLFNKDKAIIHLRYRNKEIDDSEPKRLQKILEKQGVTSIHINTTTHGRQFNKHLDISDKGVFIEEKLKDGTLQRKKVGFIIVDVDPLDLDPNHPGNRYRILKEEVDYLLDDKGLSKLHTDNLKKLMIPDPVTNRVNLDKVEEYLKVTLKDFYEPFSFKYNSGLLDAVFKDKVKTNYVPGFEFIGDKEFYMYMDDLVKFYLKEEPIIKNIPTASFRKFTSDGVETLDTKLLNEVFERKQMESVIKRVDGRGGQAVWVGPKLNKEEFQQVKNLIVNEPHAFIVQKYVPVSTMENYIVDLRLIADVGPDKILVSNTPFGRASPISGDGKVNISSQGSETAVIIQKNQPPTNVKNKRFCIQDVLNQLIRR